MPAMARSLSGAAVSHACPQRVAATAREVNQKSPRTRTRVSRTSGASDENHDAEASAACPTRAF